MISLLTNERLVASIDNDQVVLTNQCLTEATQHPYSLAQLKVVKFIARATITLNRTRGFRVV